MLPTSVRGTRLVSAHPNGYACSMTPSSAVFLPLLTALDPPEWPAVQKALVQRFGNTRESRAKAVDPGHGGILAILAVLARTVGDEDPLCAMAVEMWLSWLEIAVQ
ncbi:hypothetical protein JCM3774_004384 [Rhodotorula dairenensis]